MRRIAVVAEQHERHLVPAGMDYIVTGVGYWSVFKTLQSLDRQTSILNVGYAGSNILEVGESYRVGRSLLYAPNLVDKPAPYRIGKGYDCLSASDFVTECDYEVPVLFDMELYAILSMGFKDVISIKTVSDNLSLAAYRTCMLGGMA